MCLLHSNVMSENILHLLYICNYSLDQKSNLYNNPKGLGLTVRGGGGATFWNINGNKSQPSTKFALLLDPTLQKST